MVENASDTEIIVGRVENAWCDVGHSDVSVVTFKIGELDYQLCIDHLSSILKEKLSDASKFRGLPVVRFEFVHNDRGEMSEETIEYDDVIETHKDASYSHCFNVNEYPKLQKVVDSIKDYEDVVFEFTNTMYGKYDEMSNTERFVIKSKVLIGYFESTADDEEKEYSLHTFLSNKGYPLE